MRSMPFAGESVLKLHDWGICFYGTLQFLSPFVIALAAVALSAPVKDTILTNIFQGIVIFIGPLVTGMGQAL